MECSLLSQKTALRMLDAQDDRKVLFIVDVKGGGGKSTLCKYLIKEMGAWACQGGSARDLMYGYNTKATVACFDMARCNNADYWPWNFIENLKNGWYTSTKYQGRMRSFNPPKIIVFTNEDIPRNKLSVDRYDVLFISK